jgi:MFS family permease
METQTPATAAKSTSHALAFIAVTLLLDTIGFGLIMPVYPRLLVEITGQSLSRAAVYGGWLGFVYAAMQFVAAPILGNLSDRYGSATRGSVRRNFRCTAAEQLQLNELSARSVLFYSRRIQIFL